MLQIRRNFKKNKPSGFRRLNKAHKFAPNRLCVNFDGGETGNVFDLVNNQICNFTGAVSELSRATTDNDGSVLNLTHSTGNLRRYQVPQSITLSQDIPWEITFRLRVSSATTTYCNILGDSDTTANALTFNTGLGSMLFRHTGDTPYVVGTITGAQSSIRTYTLTSDGGGTGTTLMELYIDGVSVGTNSATTGSIVITDLFSSYNSSNDFSFHGDFAHLRISEGKYYTAREVQELHDNLYSIFDFPHRIYTEEIAGGGNITIDVPAGSLSLTGYAPTIQTPVNVNIPAASLSLTGYTPTIQTPVSVDIPNGSLGLTGYTPTITATANQVVNIPVASLTLAGLTPTITASDHQTIDIPAGALTLTGYVPTISVGGNQTIDIPVASLGLSGLAPTIQTPVSIDIPAASLTLSGQVPTITASDHQSINVPVGGLTLTGYAPTITVDASQYVEIPAGTLALAGYIPTIDTTEHISINIPVGSLGLTGYAPTINGVAYITPDNRIFVVDAENRVFEINSENRTFVIETEDRTLSV